MSRGYEAQARAVQLLFAAVFCAGWFYAGRSGWISPIFLPPIEAVAASFAALVQTQEFWAAVAVTLSTVARAYAIAAVLGVAAGYAITRSPFLTKVLEPVVSSLFAIPITLFLPLFVLMFGIGVSSKIAYGATYAFFPIALNTIAGIRNVEKRYLAAARGMGMSAYGVLRHVLLPSAFPVILTGLRIGFIICFASVLGGETISSVAGVGRAIALAAELMEPARMYAWIVFVVLTALILNALVTGIENRLRGPA